MGQLIAELQKFLLSGGRKRRDRTTAGSTQISPATWKQPQNPIVFYVLSKERAGLLGVITLHAEMIVSRMLDARGQTKPELRCLAATDLTCARESAAARCCPQDVSADKRQ